ncbi:alpha/beta fold hydrolase [Aliiroseovarius sp. YM-037]|uniref:alpha/beta fold hydrolase n=1 Tax=Aliiroseovarius sp. YM-037 TaxID=3341728 RepID=UPI003A804B3A
MALRRIILSGLAATLGLAALTSCTASQREASARDQYPPQGRFVEVDGTRMHAVVEGSGPDLVLIHGASGSLRDFTFDLVGRLAQEWRVIAIDRPGFGWSELPDESPGLAVQARLLRGTARSLGAEKPVVMGHSYGGAVALRWALDYPNDIAALVPLSAPSQTWETGLPPFYSFLNSDFGDAVGVPLITAFAPDSTLENAVREVFAPNPMPEDYAAHFGPEMTLRRQTLRTNAWQRKVLKEELRGMIPNYPRISVPVEIVHGVADTTVGLSIHSEPLAGQIPGARLTPMPGIGHMPHHADPKTVIAAINRAGARAGLRRPSPNAIVEPEAEE